MCAYGPKILRVFENKMLKVIFETKEEEVTGDWRNFCSEEYSLS